MSLDTCGDYFSRDECPVGCPHLDDPANFWCQECQYFSAWADKLNAEFERDAEIGDIIDERKHEDEKA